MRTKALVFRGGGMELGDSEVRDPGPGEVAVAVAAAGLNRADLLQRRGLYPAPPGAPADVPGLEYAGTVAALGAGVRTVREGDLVMGLVGGGAMAGRLVAHERETIPVPIGMSLEKAAAIPEAFLTAWDAFRQADLRMGETVLVQAAGSGVGTAALQLARAAGARTLGTSRTAGKLERCRPLGLEMGIVVRDGSFAAEVTKRAPAGVDVVLELVGGGYLAEDLEALAPLGRILLVGTMAGAKTEVPLSTVMRKRARIVGTLMRSRQLEEKASLARAFAREVVPLFEAGKLAPVIDSVFELSRAEEAFARLESNESFGKVVVTVAG